MGLFSSAADDLYGTLVSSPKVRALQGASRIDVAAGLMGLARVESNFKQDANGDAGHAWGFFQISDLAWKVDTARVAGDVNYQIDLAAEVWQASESAISDSLPKKTAEVSFAPAKDLPQFYNVAWQFGAGALRGWLSGWTDWSVKGFADYRDSIGKPVDRTALTGRASAFYAEYLKREADAPSFWTEVVVASVHDTVTLPSRGIEAVKRAVEENNPKGKLDDFFAWLKREIAIVGIGLVLFALAFIAALYFAFEGSNDAKG